MLFSLKLLYGEQKKIPWADIGRKKEDKCAKFIHFKQNPIGTEAY